jgi:hypothetical protein
MNSIKNNDFMEFTEIPQYSPTTQVGTPGVVSIFCVSFFFVDSIGLQ